MKITIPYGSKPGEKIVSEGFFACPFCKYKRPYVRKKVVKVSYFGFVNIPSSKALMEYIHCGGCLEIFPIATIEPEHQLKIEISEQPLPPNSLFDEWKVAFKKLPCEEILANKPELRMMNFPISKTCASELQKAGISTKLKMYNETKVNMYNILSLSNQYFEGKMKYKFEPNPADELMRQFSDVAHYILSKLP